VKAFTFVRPVTLEEAATAAAVKGSVIKAGGTDLLDRMKERIDEPDRVVWLGDVKDPTLSRIEITEGSRTHLLLGPLATLEQLAASTWVRGHAPALAEAASLAASPQIRARATLGGNLLQLTRCGYYRHASFPCFKRGDAQCPVLDDGAVQDTAGIFGNGSCASAHPSSLAPVLCALGDVFVDFALPDGKKSMLRASDLYVPPQRGRATDAALPPGAVITQVSILAITPPHRHCVYEEVRQKAAFDWALVSCCVRLDMDGEKVGDAGIWLGSVAPTPWHAEAAEKALAGKPRAKIDGFTPEQRFFLGFANVWCQNVTEAAARQRAQTDPHSSGQFRVIGPVSNAPEFAHAFGCKAGQPMVRENACRAW